MHIRVVRVPRDNGVFTRVTQNPEKDTGKQLTESAWVDLLGGRAKVPVGSFAEKRRVALVVALASVWCCLHGSAEPRRTYHEEARGGLAHLPKDALVKFHVVYARGTGK